MNSNDEFNKVLKRRSIPKPSSNLAYRISHLAKEGINRKIDHITFTSQILKMFVIPKPIYVTTFCLLLGLAIGFYSEGGDTSTQDWFLFLEIEEGDWL